MVFHYIYLFSLCRYKNTPKALDLTLGDWDLGTSNDGVSLKVKAERIIVHASYSRSTLQNDIALIKLTSKVTYTERIKPICLPTTGEFFTVLTTCMMSCFTTCVSLDNLHLPTYKVVPSLYAGEQEGSISSRNMDE